MWKVDSEENWIFQKRFFNAEFMDTIDLQEDKEAATR